jgi:hypothetical protein
MMQMACEGVKRNVCWVCVGFGEEMACEGVKRSVCQVLEGKWHVKG